MLRNIVDFRRSGRRALCAALFLLSPFLYGMGSFTGGGSPDKIPVPDKPFSAAFVDLTDIVTVCEEVSIEGKTYLEGKRGEGVLAVPFERIREVSFRLSEDRLWGTVKTPDGAAIELALNKDQKAYGRTRFGTFQIRLASLKKMTMR